MNRIMILAGLALAILGGLTACKDRGDREQLVCKSGHQVVYEGPVTTYVYQVDEGIWRFEGHGTFIQPAGALCYRRGVKVPVKEG
jgi:hypothetical protein